MASEFQQFRDHWNSLFNQLEAHMERLVGYGESGNFNAARGCANDIIDFWNEMCRANDQCERRTGRSIPDHGQMNLRPMILEMNEMHKLNRSVE